MIKFNMNNDIYPRAVVSAIIEKVENGVKKIFIQTRNKPKTSPTYTGLIEIPAGGIDSYENIFDAIYREVKEETGLEIIKIIDGYRGKPIENRKNDISQVFMPFICQQSLKTNNGLPWIGFVFRCETSGKIKMQKTEAKDPRWITIEELDDLLTNNPEKIFSLQYTVLRYYVDYVKTNA